MFDQIQKRLLNQAELSFAEALYLSRLEGRNFHRLLALSGQITGQRHQETIDLCSIINAKSGGCSEDCAFCAQAARYQTEIIHYELLSPEVILSTARRVEAMGINRFSLVTSGKALSAREFDRIIDIYRLLKKQTRLKLCASLGLLDYSRCCRLKEAGVTTYHHNLETAKSYFARICTSHSYEERVATIRAAQKAGLRVCSGGIISAGETMEQRIELAYELKDLQVDSVPVNILNPIPGTPLEKQEMISVREIIITLSLFRLILPNVTLRFAGGRKEALGELRSLGFLAGINGAIVGDFLTTPGDQISRDIALIRDLGLKIAPQS
ncbi:biotin synthase BioB [Desulforamulus ruminis]|uniref:Biotin synthase n=1 Tax=Desulforamulus ruminis (strain ATCC 23193 / DSM 2154 / NCIMB 8452 / DL) TaxID=696281 RepID=F6DNK2_DESRL|nr:biotin synthase BioB [Desulforamulus ruminis]AEG58542.1 biotin synthase [Desulforamulus ruminis DSM 2154]